MSFIDSLVITCLIAFAIAIVAHINRRKHLEKVKKETMEMIEEYKARTISNWQSKLKKRKKSRFKK